MKFILFDCDGVLVDTEAVAAKVVTEWLQTCNCLIPEDKFIAEYTGKTFGSIFKELIDKGMLSQHHWENDIIEKLEEEIYNQIVIVEGIYDCLQQLNKIEKAVISNSRSVMVKKALQATNISEFFKNRIFSSEVVQKPKPDPGVYLYAIDKLDIDPVKCVAIEDSLTGVRSAIGAGIPTIGFAGASHLQKGHDKQLLKAGASVVAYHALEIPDLVHSLLK